MSRGRINTTDTGLTQEALRRQRGATRYIGGGGLLASVDRACTRFLISRGERFDSLRDIVQANALQGIARKRRRESEGNTRIEKIAGEFESSWQT
jgi:hypothetical protein